MVSKVNTSTYAVRAESKALPNPETRCKQTHEREELSKNVVKISAVVSNSAHLGDQIKRRLMELITQKKPHVLLTLPVRDGMGVDVHLMQSEVFAVT